MPRSPIELSNILRNLNKVPDDKRDDDWYGEFLEIVPEAEYVLSSNEPVKAPDGFYYLNVSLLPADANGKKLNTIRLDDETLEDCLDRAIGIVIYPDIQCKQPPVWILSPGELHSLYYYESFAGDPEDLEEIIDAEEDNAGESKIDAIHMEEPDDEFIHPGARKFLKNFFDALGLEGTGISILHDPLKAPTRSLMLSLSEHDFKSPEQIEDALNTVSWLLPPHRPVMLDPGVEDTSQFAPL